MYIPAWLIIYVTIFAAGGLWGKYDSQIRVENGNMWNRLICFVAMLFLLAILLSAHSLLLGLAFSVLFFQ